MYDEHLKEIIHFTNTYSDLINCHIVDFITNNLWATCIPESLRSELERTEFNWINSMGNDDYPVLNNFINKAKSLSLQSCSVEINSKEFANVLPGINNCNKPVRKMEFINAKKSHEVECLGDIIGTVAKKMNNLVIDAGAGKAYLSTFLAENHNVPVLAIDSSQSCSNGAICRQKKLGRKLAFSPNLVRYVVEEINSGTDYEKMVNQNFPEWDIDRNLLLTGLHTCGSLTDSSIKTFLSTKDIRSLCIVPCCYHLTNETFDQRISFSKNARMLAQQSVERSTRNTFVPSSLFYRAILQVVFHSLGIYNARVGRGGPLHDFASYAQWAFSRIGMEIEKIPSRENLTNTFEFYAHLMKNFHIFQMLRVYLGIALEAAIMLDRIIFLQNSNQCSKVAILRLFDPMLSPRRYAVVAVK
ncbi:methyltransferase-like protein 25 [Ceratina calcarata]|uniref:Methyltransferase-like protein 25 n=1 Tax=Ceratina calcarata TaxID=156304 RepID=A0AAJ7JCG9_9HYME|nr:methyltransferase-like protein 25 [Ceratina calcarata]